MSTKNFVTDLLFVASIALCIVAVGIGYSNVEAKVPDSTIGSTYITAEAEEASEPTQDSTEQEPIDTEPSIALYDVPLNADLQKHIVQKAEAHGIDPKIIFAMAYKESTYRTDAIGDNGNSLGLLQIQPRWHSGRMEKLGCTDLLDPFQNVEVAIDYLCELLSRYGDIGKALTAYNRGHYAGTVTDYALTVMAKAEELEVAS